MYKHAKVITRTPSKDGLIHIDTRTYHEDLNQIKTEIQQNILTDDQNLLTEIIKCLGVFKDGTSETLVISIEHKRDKILITKTYQTKKELFNH